MSDPSEDVTDPPAAVTGDPQPSPTPAPRGRDLGEAGIPENLTLRVFAIAAGVLFGLNLVLALASGRSVGLVGLTFSSALGGGSVALGVSGVVHLRKRRWGEGLVLLLLLLGPWAFVLSGLTARTMMFPGGPVPLPAPGTEVAPGVSVLEYETEDGIKLKGLIARGTGAAPRPGVVYFHGNAESAIGSMGLATALAEQNLDVLIAEFRGYGGCPGSPSKAGLLRDGRAAFAALERETGLPPALVFGRSIGSGLATGLAGEGYGEAVLLLSPYTSIVAMGEQIAPWPLAQLAIRDDFDSVASLSGSQHRVTIFHGTADRVIPYRLGRALSESLGERGKLISLDDVGHNDIFQRAGGEILAEAARLAHGH